MVAAWIISLSPPVLDFIISTAPPTSLAGGGGHLEDSERMAHRFWYASPSLLEENLAGIFLRHLKSLKKTFKSLAKKQ